MTRIMYDSTTPWDIPRDAEMIAHYVDGRYAWPQAWLDMFPNAVKVSISAVGAKTAMVGDVEPGCIWPVANAVPWVLRARADGYDPTIYVNELNDWAPCRQAFIRAGVPEPHWWVARYNGVRIVPAGAVARQFAHPHDGDGVANNPWETGKHYDMSIVLDYWPGVDGEVEDMNAEDRKMLGEIHGKVLTPHNLPDGTDADDMLGQILRTTMMVRDLADELGSRVTALEDRLSRIETGGVSEERIGEIAVDAVNKDLAD